jgi:hypothetical protein
LREIKISMPRRPAVTQAAVTRAPESRPQSEDDPITLADACRIVFADKIKVATLRAEASRGRLVIFRIGKRNFTTVNEVRRMVERCRVEREGQGSTLIHDGSNGLSETDRISSAQAALKTTLQGLRGSSRNTSARNTSRNQARHR